MSSDEENIQFGYFCFVFIEASVIECCIWKVNICKYVV